MSKRKIFVIIVIICIIALLSGVVFVMLNNAKKDNEYPFNEKIVKTYKFNNPFEEPEFISEWYRDEFSGKGMPYKLVIPENHNPKKKYPVILFLHGAGEIGSDNSRQIGNFKKAFSSSGDIIKDAVLLFPQTPNNWSLDENYSGDKKGYLSIAKRLLDGVIEEYNGDSDRIYVTGLSLGGNATWRMLGWYKDFFAAGVPVCGWGDQTQGLTLSKIPIWAYHGTADNTVSYYGTKSMVEAIKAAGGKKIKFTSLEGIGHNAWNYSYSDREMFSWLLSQNKSKNKSASYEYKNCIEVRTHKNKLLLSDRDITYAAYTYDNSSSGLELTLTDKAFDKLKNEYKKSRRRIFSLYYGGEKVYDYKVMSVPSENKFVIQNIENDDFLYQVYSSVNQLKKN